MVTMNTDFSPLTSYNDMPGGIIARIDGNGRSLQVGVASYTTTVGPDTTVSPNTDGWARVSFFCEWIRNAVCAEIPDEPAFCQATSPPTSQPTSQSKASKQTKAG